MSSFQLKNALIFQEGNLVPGGLVVEAGLIKAVKEEEETGLRTIDAGGCFLLPGFIDTHTHGGYGLDCARGEADDLCHLSRRLAGQGVTAWLSTVVAGPEERTLKVLSEVATAMARGCSGAELLGIHLEGPFISRDYRAALDPAHIREVDPELLMAYWKASGGKIRTITLAPELPGALDLISLCISLGIRVSLGHSGADWKETRAALEAGASCVTHLGNAMRPLHHREPGILGAALDSDFYTELICDGLHLHPAFVSLVEKLKNPGRLILVTDAMMATGLGDGDYRLGDRIVKVHQGQSRLEGGRLAGSTLTMDQALRNLLAFTGKPLEELIPCLSTHAAQWLGIQGRKGAIEPGLDADLVLLDPDLGVRRVFCRGEEIPPAGPAREAGG